MHALHGVAVLLARPEVVRDVDAANDEHAVVLADLAPYVRAEVSLAGLDPARLQRASEGSGQSAACRGHHVVERGGDLPVRIGPVVLLDGAVYTELHGSFVGR
jgi:hypothetical protein